MLPGVGEKDFDPAKAAAQNAGSSAEEYCRSVDLNTFCTKCLAPQWFDPKVSSGPRLKRYPRAILSTPGTSGYYITYNRVLRAVLQKPLRWGIF